MPCPYPTVFPADVDLGDLDPDGAVGLQKFLGHLVRGNVNLGKGDVLGFKDVEDALLVLLCLQDEEMRGRTRMLPETEEV